MLVNAPPFYIQWKNILELVHSCWMCILSIYDVLRHALFPLLIIYAIPSVFCWQPTYLKLMFERIRMYLCLLSSTSQKYYCSVVKCLATKRWHILCILYSWCLIHPRIATAPKKTFYCLYNVTGNGVLWPHSPVNCYVGLMASDPSCGTKTN